jgi:YD repeat-containing protein
MDMFAGKIKRYMYRQQGHPTSIILRNGSTSIILRNGSTTEG